MTAILRICSGFLAHHTRNPGAIGSTTVQDLLDAGLAFRAGEAAGRVQEDLAEQA
jgi:hypothetical protein